MSVESSPPPPRPRRRRLLRWSKRLLLTAALGRLLLWAFLQPLADFGASFAGLTVSWRSASLSVLHLSVHVEGLEIREADDTSGREPLLRAQHLFADLSTTELLSGHLHVVDFGLAGAKLTLARAPDGALRLPAGWSEPPAVELPDDTATEAPAGPRELRLPFVVESLRVHGLEVSYLDEQRTPPALSNATLDLDATDLGAANGESAATARIGLPGVCDELSVEARGGAAAQRAELQLRATARGVRSDALTLPDRVKALFGDPRAVDLELEGSLRARLLADAESPLELDGTFTLGVAVNGEDRADVVASFGPTQAATESWRTPLAASAKLTGVVGQLELRDATLEIGAGRTSFAGEFDAREVAGGTLREDLAAWNVQLPPGGFDLRGAADVEVGASLTLGVTGLEIDTGAGRALKLPKLAIQDLRVTDDALAIERIELRGPTLDLRREVTGDWTCAGFSYSGGGASLPVDEAPAPSRPRALPKLRLGALSWSGASLSFTDAARGDDATLRLTDVDVRGDALAVGVNAPPGRVEVAFACPGALRSCRASASVAPRIDGGAARVELRAGGASLAALAPWLAPAGLTSALRDAALDLVLIADARLEPVPTLDLELRDVALRDGDVRWLALPQLRVSGLSASDDVLKLGAWEAAGLDVLLRSDSRGRLSALGLRFDAPRAETHPAPAPPTAFTKTLQHGTIELRDATARWQGATAQGRTRALRADLQVGAQAALDVPVDVTARIDLLRSPAELQVDARIHRTAERFAAKGDLRAAGLSDATLADLLPEGLDCTLVDGSLQAGVELGLELPSGGFSGALRRLRLRDGDDLVAALETLDVDARRLDAERIDIRTFRLQGAKATVGRDGPRLLLPGLVVTSAVDRTADVDPIAASPPTIRRLPPLELGQVELDVDELTFVDLASPDIPPTRLRGSLQLAEPWAGAPSDEDHTPMRWRVRATSEPYGAALTAEVTASPFSLSPTLDATVEVAGLDTTTLPLNQAALTGEATSLYLTTTVHARLDLRRRDPGRFDLGRTFGGELVLEDLTLGDAASGATYAQIGAVDVIARAIDPRSGDLLLRSVDVDEPFVATHRDVDGLHVAGFVLQEGDAAAQARAPTEHELIPLIPQPANREVTADRIRVTGLEYDHRDSTTQPPTHLRLVDTDGELSRFSTAAWTTSSPLSFSASLRGGAVELERRIVRSSVLSGLIRSGTSMLVGARDEHVLELRPLVDQLSVEGQLVLWPRLKGRVRASVDRLELPAFRGLARRAGVEVADGLYDARAEVDFRGYDGVSIRSDHVFTWLMLDEPPNGPLSTYLRLPAPLQTVLFLLRNNNNEQRIPLNVEVPRGARGQQAIADALVEGLAKLIGSSFANAGARATSTLTSALFGRGDDVPELAETMSFAPGSPLPSSAALAPLAAALQGDPGLVVVMHHHLGHGDLAHAQQLANPPLALVRETVMKLEQRRDELEEARAPFAQDVTALYAAGQVQAAVQKQRELERIETHLGELLEALGGALEQLDGGDARAAARRTREAARALAEARLDAAAAELRKAFPELTLDRIDRRPGRNLPTAGVDFGGQIIATLRRRTAQAKGAKGVAPRLRR